MYGSYFTALHYFALQVDGPYAAVKFPPKDSALQAAAAALSNEEAGGSLLQDVRLLRKDELQVTAMFDGLFHPYYQFIHLVTIDSFVQKYLRLHVNLAVFSALDYMYYN